MDEKQWDVFISHASEDKDSIARPLAKKLRENGLHVWYDEDVLEIGDSLFRSINYGLAKSRYGIVILSPVFFAKEWPQRELTGLYYLAISENRPILPVWHNITLREVVGRYPMMADLLAVSTSAGIEQVVEKLLRVIRREPSINAREQLEHYLSFIMDGFIKDISHADKSFQSGMQDLERMESDPEGLLHQELRKELHSILIGHDRPVKERVRAGNALSLLGDRRFRTDTWNLSDDDMLGFIEVPAGDFLMGTDRSENGGLDACECPQHSIDLPTFYINRYPVTTAQYQAFLKDTGVKDHPQDIKKTIGNHPVTSVTWLDAMQFCQWLNERLLHAPQTPTRIKSLIQNTGDSPAWVVTLPSEAEWEKAARGIKDARPYPWGAQANPDMANYNQTRLDSTSPVGCFSKGASPYGVQDLSGNVWEWTRSNWGTGITSPKFWYPYTIKDGREDTEALVEMLRIIRGGSYQNTDNEIRCSCRRADFSTTKHDHVGFRLVITKLPKEHT